jgi:hypothetical protein
MQRSGGGSDPVCGSCPFPGTGACDFYAKGGGGCGSRVHQSGGSCPCSGSILPQTGGNCGCGGTPKLRGGKRMTRKYRPTKKNLKALTQWKKGKSIGFTMTSSLKAKGLIPRTSRKNKGKRVISRKYR